MAKKTLNPEWGETFALHLHETTATADNEHKDDEGSDSGSESDGEGGGGSGGLSGVIHVHVEDYDLTGNDFMGSVRLPLAAMADRHPHRRWFKLNPKSSTKKKKKNKQGDQDVAQDLGEIDIQVGIQLQLIPIRSSKIASLSARIYRVRFRPGI